MSQWSEDLVNRFAGKIRERRKELRLSAQEVANLTAELGHPIGRSAIAGWENGTRGDRLHLVDALALTEALDISLMGFLAETAPLNGKAESIAQREVAAIRAETVEDTITKMVQAARND